MALCYESSYHEQKYRDSLDDVILTYYRMKELQ